ncbi:hypothetical protein [Actinomadura kijaniata]|uniref:hypothetical protein n=1 Tax=Actinomadura kijaniata TaxID=46161 RepID=UPI0012FC0D83|nr:hypothetical protein [Actinomadura kijaniata]
MVHVRACEIYFHGADWRKSDRGPEYYPGELWGCTMLHRVPDRMYWVIDSGLEERPYLTCEQGNQLAQELAPLAAHLIDHLVPVPGTEDLDWSAEAASAAYDIARAMARRPLPPLGRRPWLIDMDQAVRVYPELVDPTWADCTSQQLDEEAQFLTETALYRNRQILERLGNPEVREPEYYSGEPALVGARAWLYGYRQAHLKGREPVEASRWWQSRAVPITADTTDRELAAVAEAAQAEAARSGHHLTAPLDYLTQHRATLRQAVRAELEPIARRVKAAEQELRQARLARQAVLARVLSWGDPADRSDTDLGRRAGMSRQAVYELRHAPAPKVAAADRDDPAASR